MNQRNVLIISVILLWLGTILFKLGGLVGKIGDCMLIFCGIQVGVYFYFAVSRFHINPKIRLLLGLVGGPIILSCSLQIERVKDPLTCALIAALLSLLIIVLAINYERGDCSTKSAI